MYILKKLFIFYFFKFFFFFFFWMWAIFEVLIEFVTALLLFHVLVP